MGVSWVLLYDLLGYVYFFFSGDMAIVCPQRYNSSFAPHQTTHHVGIMYSSSELDSKLFFTFTLGLPIIWRAIRLHLSHPRRTKAKVSSSPVTTPHSLFQTLVRSLYHLVLAMFFISMMLCCFLKSVSQKILSVGQFFYDRQSYAIFTPTSSVLSRIYTRIMS